MRRATPCLCRCRPGGPHRVRCGVAMYRVTRETHFCYGDRLLDYEGKCRHLHGHNGKAVIVLQGDRVDERGMVMDFSDVKRTVGGWIDATLDHTMLLHKDDPVLPDLRRRGERV